MCFLYTLGEDDLHQTVGLSSGFLVPSLLIQIWFAIVYVEEKCYIVQNILQEIMESHTTIYSPPIDFPPIRKPKF